MKESKILEESKIFPFPTRIILFRNIKSILKIYHSLPSYCLSGLSKLCHIWKQKRNEISFHKIGREDFMIYDVIFIKRFSPLLVQYSYIVQFSTFIYLFIYWHHIVESNTKSCIYSIVRIWSYRYFLQNMVKIMPPTKTFLLIEYQK